MNLNRFFKNALALIVIAVAMSSCDDEEGIPYEDDSISSQEQIIPSTELPADIKTYIATHFPNNPIIKSTKEKGGLLTTYDVILQGNFVLEFDTQNKITDIDGTSKLPDSVIPQRLREYVMLNYPANVITDWELEDTNQQIELNNGLELEFTMNGDFLRIDN